MHKSETVKEFGPVKFRINEALTLKVERTGSLTFYYENSVVSVGQAPGHFCKIGALDKVYLTKTQHAYSPFHEAKLAMSNGVSEIAAVAMVYLRSCIIMMKKIAVAEDAVVEVDKIITELDIKPSTAEAIISKAEFFYAAPSWIARYGAERAKSAFDIGQSRVESILPFLMSLYSDDAHLGIVVTNFIENCLFAPFVKANLFVIYSRQLGYTSIFYLPALYADITDTKSAQVCSNLVTIYSMLDLLIRKTKLAINMPEVVVVARQTLFELEAALSSTFDKFPMFKDLDKILNVEMIMTMDDLIIDLLSMLMTVDNKTCKVAWKLIKKRWTLTMPKKSNRTLLEAFSSMKPGKQDEALHVLFGKIANIVRISVV
jgi:hypothetical protein